MVQRAQPAPGAKATRRSGSYDEDFDAEYDDPERVIPISTGRRRESHRQQAQSNGEYEDYDPPARATRRPRSRRRSSGNGVLDRHGMTIAAVVIAVAVLGYVLWQVLAVGGERATSRQQAPPGATAVAAGGPATEQAAPAPAAEAAPAPTPTLSPAERPIKVKIAVLEPNYTVEPGDTLGKIAARTGNTVEMLQGLNRLPDRSKLSIGQKLIVPTQ